MFNPYTRRVNVNQLHSSFIHTIKGIHIYIYIYNVANPLLLKISGSFHVAGDLTRGRYLHDSFRGVFKLWILRSCFCSKSEKGAIAQIEKCNLALTFSGYEPKLLDGKLTGISGPRDGAIWLTR